MIDHDLDLRDPERTYLSGDGYVRCWIGHKWDIAEDRQGSFHVYRKGSWVLCVGSFDLAQRIVADDEGASQ